VASIRGLRNLTNLREYMKWTKTSPEVILEMGE